MRSEIVPKIESVDRNLDKFQYPYLFIVGIVHFLYLITFLGIVQVDQSYLHTLSVGIQTFIVAFLLYRFHPYGSRYILKAVDKTIIFGSALLLGTNLVGVEFSKWITQALTQAQTQAQKGAWTLPNPP